MKRLLFACALVLASLAVVPTALAKPSELTREPFAYDGLRYCPYGTTVVDVTQDVVNDVDVGSAGNVWAGTYYTRRLVVTRIDSRTFCAVAMYGGKFETRAGLSPGATGIVRAGIGGKLAGNYRTRVFKATWRPTAATSGWIGMFDYACDDLGNCPGYVDWKGLYFTDVSGFAIARYSFQYQTEYNGTWTNRAPEGNSGDVTGF